MKYFKISEGQLYSLLRNQINMMILENAGVDNWPGWEFAWCDFIEDEPENLIKSYRKENNLNTNDDLDIDDYIGWKIMDYINTLEEVKEEKENE